MKEDSEENMPATYDGKGIRGWGWALFGVTTAIAAKYVMGNGGGLLGNGMPPSGDPPWARDMNYERQLTERDAKIGKLESQIYTDDKVDALRREIQAATAAQAVYNATNSGIVGTINAQTKQLMGLTGLIINAPAMAASEAAASAFKTPAATTAASNG